MRRLRISYSGRVQGVGFRATAHSAARPHPVTGWVRNEHDGSVLLEAQGPPASIDAFLADLRRRMQGNIASESIAEIAPVQGEHAFEIRH